MASQPQAAGWLAENGPKELELLFRAIVFHPSAPILLADNDRQYREASVGASKLLGLPREKIIGRSLDDFAEPSFKPVISERWQRLSRGRRAGGNASAGGCRTEIRGKSSTSPKGTCCRCAMSLVLRDKSAAPKASCSGLGAGLCAVPVGCGRTDCRLVCGSGAHLRLQERRGRRPARVAASIPAKTLSRQAAGRIEEGRRRRPCRQRRLAREKGRVAILGQRHHHGSERRERRFAGLCQSGARLQRPSRDETKSCGAAARGSGRSRRNRPSPASFPASSTGFRRPTTRFSNWSDTAARICRPAGCTGPI